MSEAKKLILVLATICFVAALGLAQVHQLTEERIAAARLEFELRAVREVIALDHVDIPVIIERKELAGVPVYRAVGDIEPVVLGVAVVGYGRGFAGPVEIIVGIDSKGVITGIEILSHRETPGLGARITENFFLNEFKGKQLGDEIKIKRDGGEIDAITGATVSARAVSEGVEAALTLFFSEKNEILQGETEWQVMEE
ncbi:RnfABCDGE type electron transport complex subunit G [candidate division NPL-UPA2 bacterium Unc8]|uniref:Ion-translocating oxidoreductase complex subunit G n=1 Tax=candidate division NPL-UPA2 bacterium Unc8 TaxID=1980939 RepID=A0A399FYT7_UNCN2|nr:MAG: RnfABCDGE type electron transport complex subunit G [candidate division NPL-UPA2 bacterium Unc8]